MRPPSTSPMFWVSRRSRSFCVSSRHTSVLLTPHAVRPSANLPRERRLLSSCSPFYSAVQIQLTFASLLPSSQSP
jgi:hypothetical protein